MNDRAINALRVLEWFNHHQPEYVIYGPIVRDVVSGDIGHEDWAGYVNVTTPYHPVGNLVTIANVMNDLCADETPLVQIVHPMAVEAHVAAVTLGVPGIDSLIMVYFDGQSRRSSINVENLRLTSGHLGVLDPHHDTPRFHELFWGAMNHQFTVNAELFAAEAYLHGVPGVIDRAQRMVHDGWQCPPEAAQLLGLGVAPDLMGAFGEPPVNPMFPPPGVAGNVFIDPAAVQPWFNPGGGALPDGVLPTIETPLAPPPVPLDVMPTAAELQAARDAQLRATRIVQARPGQNPHHSTQQRIQAKEIARVTAIWEKYRLAHQSPDERVADAHGQDIPEFADVHQPANAGYGQGGWQ